MHASGSSCIFCVLTNACPACGRPSSPLQLYTAGHARRTDLLLLLGAALYQQGQYEQCIACNDQCILLDPSMAEVGGWQHACNAWRCSSTQLQVYKPNWVGKAESPASHICLNYACTCFTFLPPCPLQAHANLANALQQLGSTDLALLYYQSGLRLRPAFPDASNNMAAAYLQKGMVVQVGCPAQTTRTLAWHKALPAASHCPGLAFHVVSGIWGFAQTKHPFTSLAHQHSEKLCFLSCPPFVPHRPWRRTAQP
jgi:tetratricopeptide (TPR) repeat protein